MKIKINGSYEDTQIKTLCELKDKYGYNRPGIVTIKNGYQTDRDLPVADGDTICFIPKDEMPDREVLAEMMSARHTPGVYDAVKDARVAIAGLGGLGSNIAVMLARTGVGHLHIIDFDTVDASNLNRQQYFIKHLGMYKTDALKEILGEINPFIEVTADCVEITEDNVAELVKSDDIICEAFDSPGKKAMIAEGILSGTDKILISGSGMAGLASGNTITTRKISGRFYLCGDGVTGAKEGTGLMAPRVTLCAAHQANMAVRIICGMKET